MAQKNNTMHNIHATIREHIFCKIKPIQRNQSKAVRLALFKYNKMLTNIIESIIIRPQKDEFSACFYQNTTKKCNKNLRITCINQHLTYVSALFLQ